MKVELLYLDGCPGHEELQPRLEQLVRDPGVGEPVELRRVESDAAAQAQRFLGSPTVRVNGRDIEPGADERNDFGLKCRLYRTEQGTSGVPPEHWITAALGRRPGGEEGRRLPQAWVLAEAGPPLGSVDECAGRRRSTAGG